ncbi:tyrosine-type recombinase/integrase [Schaalia sp. lx-100]|uniref:tyrosine-type recombinase/integrase n=1 Tax=Schaalia sp. lx-100 TaxID=2899081 RepID=UPI001E5AE739|nr:tyrosine-type recombinase/integrase [Schaalia sp. lx-100]MCD4557936.1 tyrosine-type recombinase/integrase [Schaalia sp. lx-100]
MVGKLPTGISMYKGMYRVRITVEGRQEFVGKYATLRDAKAALDIARGQKVTGAFVSASQRRAKREAARAAQAAEEAKTLTVSAWVDQWLENIHSEALEGIKSMGTYREYLSTVRVAVTPIIGDMRLGDVSSIDIEKILKRAARKSTSYEKKVYAIVRRLFNAALDEGAGGLEVSPVKRRAGHAVKTDSPRHGFITPQQAKALADAMPPLLQLTVYLGMWCEMRQGEVLGLQRGDFIDLDDPARARVRIERQWNQKEQPPRLTPTKGRDARDLSIPEALVPIILDHLNTHVGEGAGSFVFPSSLRSDAPVSQTRHNLAWSAAKKAAKIDSRVRFHDLRASGLTLYAQQGATVAEIMARGGHRDVGVAMRYQRAAAERDRELAARLPVVV